MRFGRNTIVKAQADGGRSGRLWPDRWIKRIGGLAVCVAALATIAGAAAACAAASGRTDSPTAPAPAVPAGWQTYTNAQYGFGLSYPTDYGIVAEKGAPPSGAAARVRFQEQALLTSEFVDLEPARLMVEVFAVDQGTALTTWLRANGRLPAGAATSATALAGASEGLKVQLPQQLAPNEFYYFVRGRYIFAVTPLGAHSAEMLASFRFL